MRSEAPPLLPIFRSRHQADLLTELFLHPEQAYTATDLAAMLNIPFTTVHRELQRLEQAGLLTGRQIGRARLLQANTRHRASPALTQLLTVTFGPQSVVAEEFGGLESITHVIIYGSWAARYHGVPGTQPADVDVLIVGSPDRAQVYAAAERAEARLGQPVNPTLRSTTRWHRGDDPLVQTIRVSPQVTVVSPDATVPAPVPVPVP
ncbi:MAG: hypothetical protein QG608_3041 [Actinomycetota bacterium]|nr:hypothetical protein [Actinomycetota bacterium]